MASLSSDEVAILSQYPGIEAIIMPKCKFCNQVTVSWRMIGGKWVLYNNDGTRHLCVTQKPKTGELQDPLNSDTSTPKEKDAPKDMDSETGEPIEKTIIEELSESQENQEKGNQQQGQDAASENQPEDQQGDGDDQKDGDSSESDASPQESKPKKPVAKESTVREQMLDLPKEVKTSLKSGHKQTNELYALLASGMRVFVSGPAGSGKPTAFKLVAPALGHYFQRDDYEFYFKSVCDLTGKHEFEGFINAAGQIVDTDFRKAYIEGHLFLIDEVDAANANVLTVLNATIENGWASFPDGKYPQHQHFRIGVAANTVGLGSDGIYVGRNQLDGAFRNRFYFLSWDYDEKLELRLSGYKDMPAGPLKESVKAWVERVQKLRAAHQSLGKLAPRVVISPRASINGAILLRNCVVNKFTALEDALIWQGCAKDDRERVIKAVKA